jgi:hypothetical protein
MLAATLFRLFQTMTHTLQDLENTLNRYQSMAFHTDPLVAQKLAEITNWQKARLALTNQPLFTAKGHELMAAYFLNRLYGGPNFDTLHSQICKALPLMHRVEKMVPKAALETSFLGVELSVLSVELDEALAKLLIANSHTGQLTAETMRQLYLQANQQTQRAHQMDLLDQLGARLEKFGKSFVITTAFKMGKSSAYKRGLNDLYDFAGEGFAAMKPLKSVESFIHTFTAAERAMIDRVHAGDPEPFGPANHPALNP